ncbi:MAG: hypothetical protein HY873_12420 [Chloroflexi bacterium]|nr:hypothetical protein [Chloroflexota bacterium]
MPKKLTILGALTAALVFGYLGLFNGTAAGTPIQQFDTSGAFEVDVNWCYDGAYPVADGSGGVLCGAGSSSTSIPVPGAAVPSWSIISQPIGNRLGLPITFTPSDGTTEWQTVAPACGALDANGECTAATTVGDVTARTDILCTNGADDVLGAPGGTGGSSATEWPKKDPDGAGPTTGWINVPFIRTSAATFEGGGGPPTGGPNAYVPGIAPFPNSAPNAYTFGAIDTSVLTFLYLAGGAPFPLPAPVRLQLVQGYSSYASQSSSPGTGEGLSVSAALLAGSPDDPPSDGFTCLDSPQDSVAETTYLKAPSVDTIIPRWVMITSAADLRDGTQATILDWQCVTIGTGAPDSDGDCLPDGAEPLAASCVGGVNDKDCDNDMIPDGLESYLGSSPTAANSDGDAASDFEEMGFFTDPTVADSDGDGQLDKQDVISTNGTEGADAADLSDDNCPADANASQLNTDSLYQYHGHGATTGDKSNPDEDMQGNACDSDDDNDEMPDATEAGLTIVPWSGTTDPGGAGDAADSAVCAGPGIGVAPLVVMNPLDGDSDVDLVLDGRACTFRARPDLAIRATASCLTAPVDPDGCAQPNNGAAGGAVDDPDADGLFVKGGSHLAVESVIRTMGINVCRIGAAEPSPCPTGGSATGQNSDMDGDGVVGTSDKDSDRDVIGALTTASNVQDGVETLFYGTGAAIFDTDRDGCADGEEIADHNGDFKVTAGDQLSFVIKKNTAPALGKLDPDNDGDIDNYDLANADLNKNKSLDAGDQLIMAAIIGAVGACDTVEDAIVIGTLVKNVP